MGMVRSTDQAGYFFRYVTDDDVDDFIWNSRAGRVPQVINEFHMGQQAKIKSQSQYAHLDYVPDVGDRIVVTMTEKMARIRAELLVACSEWDREVADYRSRFETRRDAVESFFSRMMSVPDSPLVVMVTSAMADEFVTRAEAFARTDRRGSKERKEAAIEMEKIRTAKRMMFGTGEEELTEEMIVRLTAKAVNEVPRDKRGPDIHDIRDRNGARISMATWERLRLDPDYSVVASDVVDNHVVLTTWLGLNLSVTKPAYFETIVFTAMGRPVPNSVRQYTTAQEAALGHVDVVAGYRKQKN